jgi:tetratricopeptide (TPR) repeat protein
MKVAGRIADLTCIPPGVRENHPKNKISGQTAFRNPIMSIPTLPKEQASEESESFEERIALLYEELAFASQHQRPSILLAFYGSESIRQRAEQALEMRLAEDGQPLVPFRVDESHFDIPLLLSLRSQRLPGDRSVFSVTGLSCGGGKEHANAYRALNMRREFFVDYAIRAVIWLDPHEAIALSRHAPDFWAFRHRVVEFNDAAEPERPQPYSHAWAEPALAPAEIDGRIALYEQQLKDLPEQVQTRTQQMQLLFGLAGLYHAKKAYDRSIQYLQRGKEIARQSNDTAWLAGFWSKLGLAYQDLEQPLRALRACRKATRLDPGRAELWCGLGHFYHIEGRFSDAIIAYKHALQLDPHNSLARSGLETCYRRLGKNDLV